jgi:hypothetical protein
MSNIRVCISLITHLWHSPSFTRTPLTNNNSSSLTVHQELHLYDCLYRKISPWTCLTAGKQRQHVSSSPFLCILYKVETDTLYGHVCPSVTWYQHLNHLTNSLKIQYGTLSLKVARQFQSCLKLDKNNTEFISTPTHISAHILYNTKYLWEHMLKHFYAQYIFYITLLDFEIIKQRNFSFCGHISKFVNRSPDFDKILYWGSLNKLF